MRMMLQMVICFQYYDFLGLLEGTPREGRDVWPLLDEAAHHEEEATNFLCLKEPQERAKMSGLYLMRLPCMRMRLQMVIYFQYFVFVLEGTPREGKDVWTLLEEAAMHEYEAGGVMLYPYYLFLLVGTPREGKDVWPLLDEAAMHEDGAGGDMLSTLCFCT
jgi:hypothetical protein